MFQKIRSFIRGVVSSDHEIVVNGVSIDGDLNVVNGKCYVNDEEIVWNDKIINVVVKGDATIEGISGFNEIIVDGNVNGGIRGMSGKVIVHGNVTGNVRTMSGAVNCGSIGGSVETISGNIKVK